MAKFAANRRNTLHVSASKAITSSSFQGTSCPDSLRNFLVPQQMQIRYFHPRRIWIRLYAIFLDLIDSISKKKIHSFSGDVDWANDHIPMQVGSVHWARGDNQAARLEENREDRGHIDALSPRSQIRLGLGGFLAVVLIIMENWMRVKRDGRDSGVILGPVFVWLLGSGNRKFREEWNKSIRMHSAPLFLDLGGTADVFLFS